MIPLHIPGSLYTAELYVENQETIAQSQDIAIVIDDVVIL